SREPLRPRDSGARAPAVMVDRKRKEQSGPHICQDRRQMILPSQRGLFDIPEDVAYFNCAYNSPQLTESRDRLRLGAESKCRPWERTSDDFFRNAEAVRELASTIFGGDSNGYAVVPAASYGLGRAAPGMRTG